MDDNCRNQLPVAIPLFDRYGFKTTLFTVPNFAPNWAGLRAASANGHEVASHTVTHTLLNTLTVAQQVTELQQSQATIIANVPTARCETVAYPNCVVGDLPTIRTYYIAGRICSGQIVPRTPPDFYNISCISSGAVSTIQTAVHFNTKVGLARTAGGWCVFLTHGIDNDGGYSPTQSTEITAHLAYMDANRADYWVGTFSEVVKYIKERNALSLTETAITADSLSLVASDNLSNTVYNVPVTVRRRLPTTWTNARVSVGSTTVPSAISTVAGVQYIVFEVVPDQGPVHVAKSRAAITGTFGEEATAATVKSWPNPFTDKATLEVKGKFSFAVYSVDGKLVEAGEGVDSAKIGGGLAAGAYTVKVSQGSRLTNTSIIKK